MDREKVVEGLKHCLSIYIDGLCDGCPYFGKLDQPYMITLQCKEILMRDALALLKEQDAVVRCKDCKHYFNGCCYSRVSNRINFTVDVPDDWFCADGKRR